MPYPQILHVSTPHSWRGGEQQLFYLVQQLKKMQVPQQVLAPTQSVLVQKFRESGLPVVPQSKAGPWDLRFARAIAQEAQKCKAAFVHVHDSQAHTFALLAQLFFGLKASLIVHRRVDFMVGQSFFSRWKYNHKGVAGIICVSQLVRSMMAQVLRKPEVLEVIYDGIDPHRFQTPAPGILRAAYQIPADTLLIGNIAALTQQKDYFTFLRTVQVLKKNGLNARYFVIGDGHQKAALQDFCSSLGLMADVIFTGFRTDIPQVLPELDVLLFSSETEGLGTTILDAFAAGVPVVTTDAGGITEVAHHMENAWVAPVKDAEALANGVLQLTAHPELRLTFVRNAKATVEAFTFEKMASATALYYKKLKSSRF